MTLTNDIHQKYHKAKNSFLNFKANFQSFDCTVDKVSRFTEQNYADYFANNFIDKLRYDHTSSKWYIWSGSYWKQDNVNEVYDYYKVCMEMLRKDCSDVKDLEIQKRFFKCLRDCEKHSALKNILALASSIEGIRVTINDFDNKAELFNCANCTLDLSGNLPVKKEFDHNDNLTQISNVIYDPNAKPVEFLKFMDTIFNKNDELIQYLQRALGYCLTGNTNEDVAFFMYGTGKNGKSTFIEIIKLIIGDYYARINMDSLIVKNNSSGINNDIACLKGARFVAGSEIEDGKRLNESQFKDITGGDDIKARFLHKEFFTFTPKFKIWMAGNHKPVIRGTDYGIKRRLKLIPFTVTIPDEITESRASILSKMEREASGILNWILEGFVEWKKGGLNEPSIITNSTDEYFNEMDSLKTFIDERCIQGDIIKESKTSVKDMYEGYTKFCENNKDEPLTKRIFDKKMKEKGGLTKPGNGNITYWTNVSLKI